jgi:hypothetical protein
MIGEQRGQTAASLRILFANEEWLERILFFSFGNPIAIRPRKASPQLLDCAVTVLDENLRQSALSKLVEFFKCFRKARRQIHGLYAARIDRDEIKIIAAFGHVDRPVGNPKLSAVCQARSFGGCRKGQPCTLARLAWRYLWRELLLAVRAPSTYRP